jgi:endonuclease/exonuclease/phosphatase family metal-dependent hydrolase
MSGPKRELVGVFYNVENLFDTVDDPKTSDEAFTPEGIMKWDEERYRFKLAQIAKAILGIDRGEAPAFMAFAEVENRRVIEDLLLQDGFKTQSYSIVHRESIDTRGIDIAFVYRKDLFSHTDAFWHDINLFSDVPINARKILQVSGFLGDQKFHFFVNHWSSRRKGKDETAYKRAAAGKMLRHAIDNNTEMEDASIIMGDFNDEPGDLSIVKHLKAKESPQQSSDLINLAWRYENHGKGSIEHDGDWYLFDQIMITQNLSNGEAKKWKVKKMYLEQNEALLFRSRGISKPNRTYVGISYKGGYSDHLPVFFRLRESN